MAPNLPETPEDEAGSKSVPAGASMTIGTEVELMSIKVPSGKILVGTAIWTYAGDPVAFGTPGLRWTLFVDGSPHSAYHRQRDQIGSQTYPRTVGRGKIKARHSVRWVAENDSGTAYTAGAGFMGEYVDK